MTKRMLIDATHAEETRVVVLDGTKLEDFDVETATKKQLKGNIYLARVVRVEPSLQAAFVEYGGGRHGFLAFGEIHPDYYQIPVADRQRLLAMQAAEVGDDDDDDDAPTPRAQPQQNRAGGTNTSQRTVDRAPEPVQQSLGEPLGDDQTPSPDLAETEAEPAEETVGEPLGNVETPSPDLVAPAAEAASDGVVERETAVEPTVTATEADAGEPDPMAEREADATRAQPAVIPREERFGPVVDEMDPAEEAAREADGTDEAELTTEEPPSRDAPGEQTPAADTTDADDREIEQRQHEAVADEAVADQAVADAGHADFDVPGDDAPPPETVGGDPEAGDGAEEARRRRESRFLRSYRIQEVIRRRQIMLIQVVKEERGGKGAALTTYISLAGRYCVLMPNSPRGGGVSRKITSAADRKRLKEVTTELDLPSGMGLIVRTAGAARPKPEIKRDAEYLMRLWDDIRELTMRSMAPALIYEEASLIKRAIRDVYSRDIDEIVVDGELGFRAAHDFMRMLMPAHAKKVQLWRGQGGQPLFAKNQVEAQLDAMLLPTVQLKSGGYLVINQTEALVAIDVNSGRATRERNVEETALKTNLEAADEAARQLRLRDLAGLIVIDFIDMESKRHNLAVESRLKNALKVDRARIQVGSISHFGLLEMSRQRLRPSLTESSFIVCPHCGGTGHVRSIETAATHVLRAIEDEGAKGKASVVMVHASGPLVMYLLNHMRERVGEIEQRFQMRVQCAVDDALIPPACRIDRVRLRTEGEPRTVAAPVLPVAPSPMDDVEDVADVADEPEDAVEVAVAPPQPRAVAPAVTGEAGDDATRRRRRRRRRGGRRDAPSLDAQGNVVAAPPSDEAGGDDEFEPEEGVGGDATPAEAQAAPLDEVEAADLGAIAAPAPVEVAAEVSGVASEAGEANEGGETGEGRRRRGRRGGRRRRGAGEGGAEATAPEETGEAEAPAPRPTYQAPAYQAPVYQGPTPADPFGAPDFDVFDLMERAQEAALLAPKPAPAPVAAPILEPTPEPVALLEPVVEPTPPAAIEEPVAEVIPAAEPLALLEPVVETTPTEEPVAEVAPVAEPVAAAEPVAEPEAEVPAVKPKAVRKPRVTKAMLAARAAEEAAAAEAPVSAPDTPQPELSLDIPAPPADAVVVAGEPEVPAEPAPPPKKGWWKRG